MKSTKSREAGPRLRLRKQIRLSIAARDVAHRRTRRPSRGLSWSALALAIASTSAIYAQSPDAQPGTPGEEIVVTGSRIRQLNGMDSPNPVTVVTPAQLSVMAPTNLIEGLAELPQFYGSATTQTPSPFFTSTGAGSLNLRGLQSNRTLQLLDGRRVVQSTIFGGPDINLFPENVIKRVETVTGGASAAYGTDAVAGAVNFILDTDMRGLKTNVQMGENENGDNQNYKVSIGGGFEVGKEKKTHILLNGEKERQDPIWGNDIYHYDWYRARALLPNPAAGAGSSQSNPALLPYNDVRARGFDLDGIFYLPTAAGGPQILDKSGTPSPFVLGSPCNNSGCSTTNGGSGHESGVQRYNITPDSGRENAFVYVKHDFTDQFSVFGQFMHGKADFTQLNIGGLFPNPEPGAAFDRNFTIFRGNPFLPAAIQQAMVTNNLASVPFSRIGALDDIASQAATTQDTITDSYTGGFNYELGGGWLIKGYFQSGETDVKAIQKGGIRLDRIYLAADVVTDPVTGKPACNVTVVTHGALYPDCVPLNLFGRGNASAAAVDWVTGFEPGVPIHADGFLSATESLPHDYVSGPNKQRIITINQDVWEVSADGKIAQGWAGPITMAAGIGGRRENFNQVVEVGPGGNINADPRYRPVMANNAALGIRGVPGGNAASGNSVEIQFSNVPFARGSQNVQEAFTEFFLPLMHDRSIVKQMNFDAAYRLADYSGSGTVDSWKGGLDWTVMEQLRFRATVSQDVRAATMGEKFDRTGGVANISDPLLGNFTYGITTFSNGTPDIRPENAKTKVFGFVYRPKWAEGISTSVDHYEINVKDNINQTTAANVVNGCYVDHDVDLCSFITRGGPPSTQDPNINYISLVGVPYYNQNSVKAEGVDVEIDYGKRVNWFGGSNIDVRLLASHLDERSNTSSAGVKTRVEGRYLYPQLTGNVYAGLIKGPLGINFVARYTGEQLLNPNFNFNGTSKQWDVADNELNPVVLVDARVSYQLGTRGYRVNIFGTINNLFDKDPQEYLGAPPAPPAAFTDTFNTGTGLGVDTNLDMRGRRYVLGVAVSF
jgi:iron complex outermembrane recepter protein